MSGVGAKLVRAVRKSKALHWRASGRRGNPHHLVVLGLEAGGAGLWDGQQQPHAEAFHDKSASCTALGTTAHVRHSMWTGQVRRSFGTGSKTKCEVAEEGQLPYPHDDADAIWLRAPAGLSRDRGGVAHTVYHQT